MHTTAPKKILLTFARSFLSLEIARHCRSAGHEVFVTDSLNRHVTKYSNAVKKSFRLPSPRFDTENYLKGLIEIINQEKIDLLVPVYEEISYITKAAHLFPSFCKIFAPQFDLYHELQNKWFFQKKLQSLGIETLKFSLIQNNSDLQQLDFTTPFAIKPCYSRASQQVKKVTPEQLPSIKITIEPHNPWIAQEWAVGKKYCTYSICHAGKICAHGVYPVNYAIDGNSCLTFKAIEHDGIFRWIANFVKQTNYTGQIAFDFIEMEDNQLFAIECNPRATSGLLLFGNKSDLCSAFFGTNDTPIKPKPGTRRQIAMGMLLYGWRKGSKPNNRLKNFLRDFFSTKDVIFQISDPKPFFSKPFIFTNFWLNSKRLGLTIPNFFTYDHDWNGEAIKYKG
jgi:hypothetical protein